MTYPFLTLDDDTEFVHSEVMPSGRVRVDIERPDAELCFKTATCWLPDYTWEGVSGFTEDEVARLREVVESCAHLIMWNGGRVFRSTKHSCDGCGAKRRSGTWEVRLHRPRHREARARVLGVPSRERPGTLPRF